MGLSGAGVYTKTQPIEYTGLIKADKKDCPDCRGMYNQLVKCTNDKLLLQTNFDKVENDLNIARMNLYNLEITYSHESEVPTLEKTLKNIYAIKDTPDKIDNTGKEIESLKKKLEELVNKKNECIRNLVTCSQK